MTGSNNEPHRHLCELVRPPLLATLLSLLLLSACGAKTGLLVPDASHEEDTDPDVVDEPDVEVDDEPDVCRPDPVEIDRRRAEVMFVVDRSASMWWTLDGDIPEVGETTRWQMLREDLGEALYDVELLLEVGAKFFPRRIDPGDPVGPESACEIDPGIELRPAAYNTDELLAIFDRTAPEGGTPTALAIEEARGFLAANVRPGVSQFIVLATDGGPNCNLSLSLPCICTGDPEFCDEAVGGVFNCLDAARTLDVITRTYSSQGVPVFVIGIDDPTRSDLADFLDEMAVAGGRPRTEPGERLFYSVRREGELRAALESITDSIARCLFVVDPSIAFDPRLEVVLDGTPLTRDVTHDDGWDWTAPDAGELTLFGEACERASQPSARVTARLVCTD